MRARSNLAISAPFLTAALLLALAGAPAIAGTVIGDFNDDSNADILWDNRVLGNLLVWNCDGSPNDGSFVLGTQPLNSANGSFLTLVGRGDFNSDGATDLLWRNRDNGENFAVFSPGGVDASTQSLPTVTGRNWRMVGVGDFNNDNKSDVLWRNPKEGRTIIWLMDGVNVSQAVELPMVTERAWHPVGVGDFTGDGNDDILWRNQRSGANTVWEMNGTTLTSNQSLSASVTDLAWQVGDVADFNNDGKPDILWRNTITGANVLWQLDGLTVTNSVNLPTVLDRNWQIAGMKDLEGTFKNDDFNNDGRPDIFWRNANGSSVMWLMSSATTVGSVVSLPAVNSADWVMTAMGDLNHDRKPDLLWRNTVTGQNVLWLMNGTTLAGTVALPDVATDWFVFAIADANNDGINDIYWRTTVNGAISVWLMDGSPADETVVTGTMTLPGESYLGWNPCGVGDLDHNGSPDIVWRSDSGSIVVWFMNGSDLLRQTAMPPVTDLNWRIVKVSDMNDDGTPDLLWRNTQTGDNSVWIINTNAGNLFGGSVSPPSVADTAWQVQERANITP